jgi:heterotetrameric sarcosine oxidase delta subunit
MLLIRCPWCGERDHTEFTYGGDANVMRPAAEASAGDWVDYVYLRDNPRGPHCEYWHHVKGCRQWLRVVRDTMTHEISQVAPATKTPEAG